MEWSQYFRQQSKRSKPSTKSDSYTSVDSRHSRTSTFSRITYDSGFLQDKLASPNNFWAYHSRVATLLKPKDGAQDMDPLLLLDLKYTVLDWVVWYLLFLPLHPPGQFHGHFRPPHFGPGTPPSQRPTQTTPSSRSNSGTPYTSGKQPLGRIPNIPLGQHWKPDEEHYDTQKLNGLTLPRTIRSSSWTQLKDIEGCDPLTVPLSKLLYQGSENFWLRKLAAGREVYVATMGEVSQVVFVSEILSQLRSRGIDLDKLAQHKALQDGHAL